jgi:putative SOS response-associated peptidase YedK
MLLERGICCRREPLGQTWPCSVTLNFLVVPFSARYNWIATSHTVVCSPQYCIRVVLNLSLVRRDIMPAMCGRYVSPDEASIEREFNLVHHEWQFPMSYNVAPTQSVPVVRIAADGERAGVLMHWGLIPYWAKGVQPKYSTINATIEKLTEAATWRGPWSRGQRCILPAAGFYEWQVQSDGRTKQPYYITATDQAIFGFAGLWDRSKRDDGTKVESCAIITMPASKLMSEIHNAKQRMPAILTREDRDAWLKGTPDQAFAALKQYPDAHLMATPVSTRVNAPKNNDAKLIERVAA